MGYSGGSPSSSLVEIALADLKLTGIPQLPGRTIDAAMIAGDSWYTLFGGICTITLQLSLRFGEAGSVPVLYFGLPEAIPPYRGLGSGNALWQATSGPAGFVRALVAADTVQAGRNYIQLQGFTTTIGTNSNWPIAPTGRRFISGQLTFPVQ